MNDVKKDDPFDRGHSFEESPTESIPITNKFGKSERELVQESEKRSINNPGGILGDSGASGEPEMTEGQFWEHFGINHP